MSGIERPVPPLTEMAAWKAATDLLTREAAVVAWVRRGQVETETEHAVVLTRDGLLLYAGTSDFVARVRVPVAENHPDVVLHHSHPGEDSLSSADLHVAWAFSRESEVRAYTIGGSSFAARSLVSPERWRSAREAARSAVASELRVLGRRDRRSYAYLAPHLVNVEMERFGLLWYQADLGLSSRQDMNRLASDLCALRALIHQELRDV